MRATKSSLEIWLGRVQSLACWACGEQIEVPSVVYALPRAEVRTSAGRRSVPGDVHLCRVITRLHSGVDESGDRVVVTGQSPSLGGHTTG